MPPQYNNDGTINQAWLDWVENNPWFVDNSQVPMLSTNQSYNEYSSNAYLYRGLGKPQETGAINPNDTNTYVKPENDPDNINVPSNEGGGISNGGFSWANLAVGIPGAINNAKEILTEEPQYRGTVWGNNSNYKTNPWQTAGAILGTGKASYYARNPWADPKVQGMIGSEKNKFDTYRQSLTSNYKDLNSLAQARGQFGNLGFNKTLRDFGGDRTFGDKAKSVAESTAAGAASGSIGGLWGMLGGAATGFTEGILANSDYGDGMGKGMLLGALTGITGGDPITSALFGAGIFGRNKTDRDAIGRRMRNEFYKEQNYLNKKGNATYAMNYNNIMNNNIRNMRSGITAAFGGNLSTQGGNWTDGLTFIDNGGSHESNPFGGIPMGIAPDGQPNLVEQNEVIWNDYVFSDRMDVPEELRNKYKLGGELTFSGAVKKLQKSAEERPNDPIEKRTLGTILADLAQTQELIRQQKEQQEAYNQAEDLAAMFADGGPIHIAKNKRGTFTAAAKKHGMGVQEFASKVLANKEDYSPAMVKKANFARNASKWSHAFGGHLHAWGDYLDNPALVTDMIGLGQAFAYNYPSYTSERNAIAQNAMNMLQNVSYQPLSGKLAYEPIDVTVPLAVQEANNAATRSAIRANVNNNRQAAINSLLASNWNDNIAAGALYQQALNDNYARKRDVAAFNLGIDKDNASMFLDTSKINAEQAARRANMYLPTALSNIEEQKENWYQKRANIANAISHLGTNLAAQHKSLQERDWNDMLLNTGYYGTIPLTMKPKHWTDKQWEDYQKNLKKYKDENELWKYLLEHEDEIKAWAATNKKKDGESK